MTFLSKLAVFLILASLLGFAQQNTQARSNETHNSAPVNLTGCLSGSHGHYTLTTNDGNLYQLQGDESWGDYSGKYVKVSGVEGPPEKNFSRNPNATTSALRTAPPRVRVNSIDVIHGVCQ